MAARGDSRVWTDCLPVKVDLIVAAMFRTNFRGGASGRGIDPLLLGHEYHCPSAIELMLLRCADKDAEPRTITASHQLLVRGSG